MPRQSFHLDAEKVLELARDMHMDVAALAKRANIGKSILSKILFGTPTPLSTTPLRQKASMLTIGKLCKVLKVNVDDIRQKPLIIDKSQIVSRSTETREITDEFLDGLLHAIFQGIEENEATAKQLLAGIARVLAAFPQLVELKWARKSRSLDIAFRAQWPLMHKIVMAFIEGKFDRIPLSNRGYAMIDRIRIPKATLDYEYDAGARPAKPFAIILLPYKTLRQVIKHRTKTFGSLTRIHFKKSGSVEIVRNLPMKGGVSISD